MSTANETTVQDIKDTIGIPTSTVASALDITLTELASAKGTGWTDETLKKIKELVENLKVSAAANFQV